MTAHTPWITACITEAQKCHPLVTEAVSSLMEELLKDRLAERPVPAGELAKIAAKLITAMLPDTPEAGIEK